MRDPRAHDIADVREAAIELSMRGLTDHDIGAALRIDPAAIRHLLAAPHTEAAALHASAWRQTLTMISSREV